MARMNMAERLGSLREGWSFSSDKTVEVDRPMTTPERVALRNKQTARQAVEVTDSPRSFPRVNPRELMPRSWFGVNNRQNPKTTSSSKRSSPQASQPTTATDKPASSARSVGSAQARLLRDMRRTPNNESKVSTAPMPSAAQRAQPRAGSVLSPGAPTLTPSSSQASAYNSRLARSIAAEVAGAMESVPAKQEVVAVAVEPELAVEELADEQLAPTEGESEERLFTTRPAGESLLPFGGIEGTTPTEEPTDEAEQVVEAETATEPAYAEGESGRISVAARTIQPTKLPMYIGDRYGDDVVETTIETAESPESHAPMAKAAFASGPTVTASLPAAKTVAVIEDDLLLTQRMLAAHPLRQHPSE